MALKRTYLDYNASAPLRVEARKAALRAMDAAANASSIHSEGRKARAMVEAARREVAELVGASADHVVFTSGATEAAQLALSPALQAGRDVIELETLYVSAIEHPCVQNGGRFADSSCVVFPVTDEGIVDVEAFTEILTTRSSRKPFLAAMMLANNETGIIQPVAEIGNIVHEQGGYLLVDAVQAAGKIAIDVNQLDADFLVLSSHKIGGLQGAGALVLRDKNLKPRPLIAGGGQEFKLRAGTESLAAIAAFGAASLAAASQLDRMGDSAAMRDAFEDRLETIAKRFENSLGPLVIFGRNQPRLANTSCFSLEGINAETALISLDLNGIAVSSGSACSSGRVEPSHVLKAMGINERLTRAAMRISTGWDTNLDDLDIFLEAWSSYLNRLT